MVRLMQSNTPFQRWQLVCFHSNTFFITIFNSLLNSLHTLRIRKRSVEKYKNYGTHFRHVFCEVGVVPQCTETHTGVVQDGLTKSHRGQVVLNVSACNSCHINCPPSKPLFPPPPLKMTTFKVSRSLSLSSNTGEKVPTFFPSPQPV